METSKTFGLKYHAEIQGNLGISLWEAPYFSVDQVRDLPFCMFVPPFSYFQSVSLDTSLEI